MSTTDVGRIQVVEGMIKPVEKATTFGTRILSSKKEMFSGGFCDGVLQADNASRHTAKLVKEWFSTRHIKLLSLAGIFSHLIFISNLRRKVAHSISKKDNMIQAEPF